MRENFADALEHDDAEEFLRLLEEKTQQIVKVLMPCPTWDLPLVAAILEFVAGEMMKAARRQPEILNADKVKTHMLAAIRDLTETYEVTIPTILADKLREMEDKP